MTNFPNNLSIFRRRAGYTQEGLAEALGVSRQAISKWESGQTLPEAATLLTLADLLDCSLDRLMREDLSQADFSDLEEGLTAEEYDLFVAYDRHMNRFAAAIACGVALVLFGVAALLAFYSRMGESGFIVLPLLLAVAVAVFLFIFFGISHEDFQKHYPHIPDCYTLEERDGFGHFFRIGMAVSVSLILVDVALLVGLAVLFEHNQTRLVGVVALFMLILAGAVGTIVAIGILQSKYDLPEYTRESLAITAPETPGSRLSGAIMLSATAVFLVAGFLFHAWHPAWIAFPVGGMLCGIVGALEKK